MVTPSITSGLTHFTPSSRCYRGPPNRKLLAPQRSWNDICRVLCCLTTMTQAMSPIPKGDESQWVLTYEDAMLFIRSMPFYTQSDLFGRERNGSFQGIVAGLYQTFGGEELYRSTQEKAANLLYQVVKDHPFSDGNKRCAAALFVYFLNGNSILGDDDSPACGG